MDTSKLPRLSQTPAPPPAEQPQADVGYVPSASYPATDPREFAGGAGAAWISFAVGALLLLIDSQPLAYLFQAPDKFAAIHHFWAPDGTPQTYTQSIFFWGDLALYTFILALFAEGIVILLARKPALVAAAFALTILGTISNLAYVVLSYNIAGLALLQAAAVAVGGYMAIVEWSLFQVTLRWRKSQGAASR
jgi:hypothetical protein